VQIRPIDILELKEFVKKEKVDLTIVVPESSLALGIVDEFKKDGLRIFGPTKQASQVKSSKSFAKHFMERCNLPTAKFEIFNDYKKAEDYVRSHPLPLVIKVNGLTPGNGVFICEKLDEALFALDDILIKRKFGEAGNEAIIEELLLGSEVSIHAFTDGKNYSILPIVQDFKRLNENNKGPNTKGMGAIISLPFADIELFKKIEDTIITPMLSGMSSDGNTFLGIIYPELIRTNSGMKILECNASFGDPAIEAYVRLLDTDLLDIIDACIDGNLSQIKINWKKMFSCVVVLVSDGYPKNYEKWKIIDGIKLAEKNEEVVIFHAGTILKDGNLVTNGGRVLVVSAAGKTKEEAVNKTYEAVSKMGFHGMKYRKDIGK